jgi:hypothetical protein
MPPYEKPSDERRRRFVRVRGDIFIDDGDDSHEGLAGSDGVLDELKTLAIREPINADAGFLRVKKTENGELLDVFGRSSTLQIPRGRDQLEARRVTITRLTELTPECEVVLGNIP